MTFIQARHYHAGRRRNGVGPTVPVRLICIHAAQSPEGSRTAEQVAHYFQVTGRDASAHECVDADSWVGCVRDEDTAWAAQGANVDGWHIELAGMSEQSSAQWRDAYSRRVLALAAKRVALRCRKFGIPPRWLTVEQLKDGRSKGLTTHADVTKSGIGSGDHWDPGPGFPRAAFLAMVQAEVDALGGHPWLRSRVAKVAAGLGAAGALLLGVTLAPDPAPPRAVPSATSPGTPTGAPTRLTKTLHPGYGWFLPATTYTLESIGRRYGLTPAQVTALNPTLSRLAGPAALVHPGTPVKVRGNAGPWDAAAYRRVNRLAGRTTVRTARPAH